jgi:hypothetical protein
MSDDRLISRRHFLHSALVGGTGLAAAALVGCGDDDSNNDQTTEPTATPGVITTTPEPTLASPRWGRLPEAVPVPPARRDHSLVTDGQRLYLFGGRDSAARGDFWVYNLTSAQWTEVTAAGPAPRFGHNALYSALTSVMLVFGGQGGGFFNDIWTYTPTQGTWREAVPAGGAAAARPTPRYGAASAGTGEPIFITHGFTDTGRFDDTWAFGAGAWEDFSPPAGSRPVERCLTRAVGDQVAAAVILFGGQTDSAPFLGDTWQLTFGSAGETNWTEIPAQRSPSPRNLFSMVFDDERRRALLFGGNTETGPVNDVWVFDAQTALWSQLGTQGEAPSPRSGHDAVWLPGRRSMLVFGGQDEGGDQADLWELAFHG